MEEKAFFRIIDELCNEKKIKQKKLSYGWVRNLSKDGINRNIVHYQFDLNSASAYNIAGDKYATYELLKENNIPTIKHNMIFNPNTRSNFYNKDYINSTYKLLDENKKIVLKANNSYQGKDVYICENKEQVGEVIEKLFKNNDSLSSCPYYDIDYEYRVIYLCDEILYVYKKRKPFVTGNGEKTIRELIKNKYNNDNINILKELDLNYIPKQDEEITISWKHNLSNGAIPIVIDENDEYIDNIKEVALKSAKAINIKFASIDIALTSRKEVLVMEINASVCMNIFIELIPDGYKIAKSIYSKAINKMFEN